MVWNMAGRKISVGLLSVVHHVTRKASLKFY